MKLTGSCKPCWFAGKGTFLPGGLSNTLSLGHHVSEGRLGKEPRVGLDDADVECVIISGKSGQSFNWLEVGLGGSGRRGSDSSVTFDGFK